jgi:hypothetical protein
MDQSNFPNMSKGPWPSKRNHPLLYLQQEAQGKYLWQGAWFGQLPTPAAQPLLGNPSLRLQIANVQDGIGFLLAFCRDRIVCDPMPPKKLGL